MAHEDMRYYRGQYRERLLPLLRECREKEEDSTNSFICLLKKMKEARLMDKIVEEKEEAFMERMDTLSDQWKDLHARRAQLKAHVVKSGSTVKENERLKNQALKKAKEEKEQNAKMESELLEAKRELETLTKQQQKLSRKLHKYSVFKKYLENVVEKSQFRDVEDLISFYKALVRTRKDLAQSQWGHGQLMEQATVLLRQLRAEREAEMLRCKNEMEKLKESLSKAQSDRVQLEGVCAKLQDRDARKAAELKSLNMAIHSLFHAASARLQAKGKGTATDSPGQLEMIQQFIYDLQDFTEDMRSRSHHH